MISALPLRSLRRTAPLVALGFLVGCTSIVAPPSPVPATYDLGPIELGDGAVGRVAIEVVAPPRIDQSLMRYRLSYANSYEVHSYTRSRWEAPPGRLLGERLAQAWPGPTLGGCRLVVAVEEWIHDFAAPDRSRVVLAVGARLMDRSGRQAAQRNFLSEVAATRHDAPGMAAASREAATALLKDLSAWLATDGLLADAACQSR